MTIEQAMTKILIPLCVPNTPDINAFRDETLVTNMEVVV